MALQGKKKKSPNGTWTHCVYHNLICYGNVEDRKILAGLGLDRISELIKAGTL
jgi:hypothetical protein